MKRYSAILRVIIKFYVFRCYRNLNYSDIEFIEHSIKNSYDETWIDRKVIKYNRDRLANGNQPR